MGVETLDSVTSIFDECGAEDLIENIMWRMNKSEENVKKLATE